MEALALVGGAVGGLGGLGTILEIGGTLAGIAAAQQSAAYNAQVAMNNAQIADENAQRSVYESQLAAQEGDKDAQAEIGFLLSESGATGFDVGSGSIAGRRRSLDQLAAKDRGYTRTQGDIQGARYKQQAQDFRSQAEMEKATGANAAIAGIFDIGTSLVSGAAGVNKSTSRRITASPTTSPTSRYGFKTSTTRARTRRIYGGGK